VTESSAVIFDVDGVLVDSYRAHYASWQKLARRQKWTITEAQFAATFGRTSREIIAEVWSRGRLSEEQIAELDRCKETLYREILQESFPVMEGAAPLIAALDHAGFALAVGSSGPPENVQLVLDHVDPDRRIGAVITGDDVTRGKPDPQVFLLGAEQLAVPSCRCAVVEDAPAGVAAAHAAGMRCVALVSTGRTPDELNSADLVVSSLRQLSPARIERLLTQSQ
jgi:beta-phosphoglucomutase